MKLTGSNKNIEKHTIYFVMASLILLSLVTSENVFAAEGLGKVKEGVSEAQKAIYALLGTGAAVYLLVKGFMLKINKIGWNDLMMSLVSCGVVAGLPALATWFWGIGEAS